MTMDDPFDTQSNESSSLMLQQQQQHTLVSHFEAGVDDGQGISFVIAKTAEVIFLVLIFAASVVSNSLVFALFYQRPTLRSLSNRFVLNLALCDLLYSLLVIPYVIVSVLSDGRWTSATWWCQLTKVATVLLALGCAFSVLLIAIDRYCAVMNPLHYNMTITRLRSSVMITASWILASVMAIFPLFELALRQSSSLIVCDCWTTVTPLMGGSYKKLWYSITVSCLGFVLPFVLLCWIYCCMYRAAHQSSVRVRRHSVTLNPSEIILNEVVQHSGESTPLNGSTTGSLLGHHLHHQNSNGSGGGGSGGHGNTKKLFGGRRRSSNASLSVVFFREEGKAAQTGALVITTFAFCWLPYFAFVLFEAHSEWRTIPVLGRTLAQHLTFVGCALNPFVYVYRNRVVWKDARQVLQCRTRSTYNSYNQHQHHHHHHHHQIIEGNLKCYNNGSGGFVHPHPTPPPHDDHHQILMNLNNNTINSLKNNQKILHRQSSRSLLRAALEDRISANARLLSDTVAMDILSSTRPSLDQTNDSDEADLTRDTITIVLDVSAAEVSTTVSPRSRKRSKSNAERVSSWSLPNPRTKDGYVPFQNEFQGCDREQQQQQQKHQQVIDVGLLNPFSFPSSSSTSSSPTSSSRSKCKRTSLSPRNSETSTGILLRTLSDHGSSKYCVKARSRSEKLIHSRTSQFFSMTSLFNVMSRPSKQIPGTNL